MAISLVPRSRFHVIFIVSLLVGGYFAYEAASGWYHNHRISEERAQAEREIVALEEKQAYLEAVVEYVQSDEFVEQQARRELGYARPGETTFIVDSPEPEQDRVVAGDWWERLFPR